MKKFFLLLTITTSIIYMKSVIANIVDDVADLTENVGVFSVTINNRTKKKISLPVDVSLTVSIKECGDPNFTSFGTVVTVSPKSLATIQLIKPLTGSWPNDYLGDGYPLPETAEVKVSLGPSIMNIAIYYPATYISGTKFVKVPDTSFDYYGREQRSQGYKSESAK